MRMMALFQWLVEVTERRSAGSSSDSSNGSTSSRWIMPKRLHMVFACGDAHLAPAGEEAVVDGALDACRSIARRRCYR